MELFWKEPKHIKEYVETTGRKKSKQIIRDGICKENTRRFTIEIVTW